jgi:hypothetical protein
MPSTMRVLRVVPQGACGGGGGAALGVLWAGGFGAVAFNVYKLQNGEE